MTWTPVTPQQLGPNWMPQQFQHWSSRGYEALGTSATSILLLVMDGATSIHTLCDKTGLSASVVTGHVRRLSGKGLVHWTFRRGEPITPTHAVVVNIWDVLEPDA